jgi:hypothetical protein
VDVDELNVKLVVEVFYFKEDISLSFTGGYFL